MTRHVPNRTALLGLVVSVVVGFIMVANYSGLLREPFTTEGDRIVKARFANTQQLKKGDLVRIDGLDAGKVDSIDLDPDGRSSTVMMKITDDAGKLHADARAELRFHLLLGASFYVRLQRGSTEAGELGSRVIPTARTSGQVEVDDIVRVIQGRTRRGLRSMLDATSKALSGAPVLPGTLRQLTSASPDIATATKALRGQQPAGRDLRELVRDVAGTVKALDAPNDDLEHVVSNTGRVVSVTAARSRDLQTLIGNAPATTAQMRRTFADLDATLDRVDPLVAKLQPVAPAVAPTLASLRGTASRGAQLLRTARPLVGALRPALTTLARASRNGVPLLDALHPGLRRLNDSVLPGLNERDQATQLTPAEAIGPALSAFGQAGGQMDRDGHFIRFPASAGHGSVYLPCQTLYGADELKLIECQNIQEALKTMLTYNPFSPPPGVEGEPGAP